MLRAYYSASIADFLQASTDEVLGKLSRNNDFALIHTQRDAWVAQIDILNKILAGREGSIYFEYSIPRMGREWLKNKRAAMRPVCSTECEMTYAL